jgi:hypothetical protein
LIVPWAAGALNQTAAHESGAIAIEDTGGGGWTTDDVSVRMTTCSDLCAGTVAWRPRRRQDIFENQRLFDYVSRPVATLALVAWSRATELRREVAHERRRHRTVEEDHPIAKGQWTAARDRHGLSATMQGFTIQT